ncbi:hypothetical protein Pvag_pPag30114 (plasmid) [Pantoea vagans C9-1]|nr:hypothetical protein Pvag_pPag30114 [Pantoea vagans C9-1]
MQQPVNPGAQRGKFIHTCSSEEEISVDADKLMKNL